MRFMCSGNNHSSSHRVKSLQKYICINTLIKINTYYTHFFALCLWFTNIDQKISASSDGFLWTEMRRRSLKIQLRRQKTRALDSKCFSVFSLINSTLFSDSKSRPASVPCYDMMGCLGLNHVPVSYDDDSLKCATRVIYSYFLRN